MTIITNSLPVATVLTESLNQNLFSGEVIVLTDSSKIGVQAFYQIAPLNTIDVIISEQTQPSSWTKE